MKSKDHVKITQKAIELFKENSSGNSGGIFSAYQKVISKGVKDEDTTPFATRGTNWHFYKENENLVPREVKLLGVFPTITIYPTSEHILTRRIKQLENELKKSESDDQFLLMGKVIHHLQDMSTPSHVVPVYHGMEVKNPYEKYVNRNIDEVLNLIKGGQDGFSTVQSYDSLISLYTSSAEQTLKYLFDDQSRFSVTVDGQEKQTGCELFWQRYGDPKDQYSQDENTKFEGFGRFTTYGINFGVDPDDATDEKYLLDDVVYRGIMTHFIGKAVAETVAAFAFIDSIMH